MSLTHVAEQPTAKTMYEFIPNETFERFGSEYIQGMAYHVRYDNFPLHENVQAWEKAGLVKTQETTR